MVANLGSQWVELKADMKAGKRAARWADWMVALMVRLRGE